MLMRLIIMTLFIMISSQVFAGTGYEVTVETDEETKSYMVIFGGGRLFEQHTGFDPDTKKFVYLRWARAEEPPKPVAKIWKHDTGEIIRLFKFPNAKSPLPVIPSIKAMKVCPFTGSKELKAVPRLAID